jgi:hypothetical protein
MAKQYSLRTISFKSPLPAAFAAARQISRVEFNHRCRKHNEKVVGAGENIAAGVQPLNRRWTGGNSAAYNDSHSRGKNARFDGRTVYVTSKPDS